MRFKMDRLCELAGVPLSSRRGKLLREGTVVGKPGSDKKSKDEGKKKHADDDDLDEGMYEEDHDQHEGMYEEDVDEGMYEEDVDEGMYEEDQDEVVEIDEKELVQELRRARRIMQEGKKKAQSKQRRRKKALQEAQLKAVIDQEVKNIIKEMDLNLNSDWLYGSRKPKKSRKGYTHQGSFLKGIGFK